jgi:hypothetical protein
MTTALMAAGCMARVGYTASVSNEGYGPDLVYAAPGVQVIADYDEPIFYSDSFYWRFSSGGWYRSSYYTGGWASAPPPPAVQRIDRPIAFVHYRPSGWVGHREGVQRQATVGDRRDDRSRVEARRVEPAPRAPMYQPAPRPMAAPAPRAAPPPARVAAPPPRADRPESRDRGRHEDRDHEGHGR